MRQLDYAFWVALRQANGDIENARQELWRPDSKTLPKVDPWASMQQTYHLLLVTGEDGKVTRTIVFPRNGEQCKSAGGYSSTGERDHEDISFEELQELIQKNRSHLKAL